MNAKRERKDRDGAIVFAFLCASSAVFAVNPIALRFKRQERHERKGGNAKSVMVQ